MQPMHGWQPALPAAESSTASRAGIHVAECIVTVVQRVDWLDHLATADQGRCVDGLQSRHDIGPGEFT